MIPGLLEWEIKADADGRLHRRSPGNRWTPTALTPHFKVALNPRAIQLAAFIALLSSNKVDQNEILLPSATLLRIGEALATALLGSERLPDGGGWIKLMPEAGCDRFSNNPEHDALIRGIPWPILACSRGDGTLAFLAREAPGRRWIVTLAHGTATQVRFPSTPRILIAAPRVERMGETEASSHLEDLFRDLPSAYLNGQDRNCALIRVVRKWGAFHDLLTTGEFSPHVIYFYGHGRSGSGRTELMFERSGDEWGEPVSVGTLRRTLEMAVGSRPHLLFANCCDGEADAANGLGVAVADLVDVLLTHRGKAVVEDARRMGTSLMRRIVLEQIPPHQAMLDFYDRDLSAIATADEGGRWAVPVLYSNYSTWAPQSLAATCRTIDSLVFYKWLVPERVGRDKLSETVQDAVGALQQAEGRGVAAVFWRSTADQGLEEFVTRLHDDLRERFPAMSFNHVTVEMQADAMPGQAAGPLEREQFIYQGIIQALENAHQLLSSDQGIIATALGRRIPLRAAANSIIVVTYRSLDVRAAWILRELLQVWTAVFEDAAGGRPGRLLLAFPLKAAADQQWQLPDWDMADQPMRLLDLTPEFGPLMHAEVVGHLKTFRSLYRRATPGSQDQEARAILGQPGGSSYSAVVLALRTLITTATPYRP